MKKEENCFLKFLKEPAWSAWVAVIIALIALFKVSEIVEVKPQINNFNENIIRVEKQIGDLNEAIKSIYGKFKHEIFSKNDMGIKASFIPIKNSKYSMLFLELTKVPIESTVKVEGTGINLTSVNWRVFSNIIMIPLDSKIRPFSGYPISHGDSENFIVTYIPSLDYRGKLLSCLGAKISIENDVYSYSFHSKEIVNASPTATALSIPKG